MKHCDEYIAYVIRGGVGLWWLGVCGGSGFVVVGGFVVVRVFGGVEWFDAG